MSSAEILSYIPRQKKKNDQVKLEAELDKITNYRKFKNKAEYQKHVIVKHPGKLCYPSNSDGVESQGMKWEI